MKCFTPILLLAIGVLAGCDSNQVTYPGLEVQLFSPEMGKDTLKIGEPFTLQAIIKYENQISKFGAGIFPPGDGEPLTAFEQGASCKVRSIQIDTALTISSSLQPGTYELLFWVIDNRANKPTTGFGFYLR